MHCDMPVAHDVFPVLHGFIVGQSLPLTHGEHMPPLQTMSGAQSAPSIRFMPVSVQLTAGEQTVFPA
jgi:hypothetical protein